VNGSALHPGHAQTIVHDDVRTFRRAAIDNGYTLVCVGTRGKAPLRRGWQRGEDTHTLLDVRPEAFNTGLVLGELRCVDIDVDGPQVVSKITEAAALHLPAGALIRGRENSSRIAMLYRAAEGAPPKRAVAGQEGKIEALGAGQQLVVHGVHPSGARLHWVDERGPHTIPPHDLPAVSEGQITSFLNACRPLLGAALSEVPLSPATAPEVAAVNAELSGGIEQVRWFDALEPRDKAAVVRACLEALDNREHDPRERWLRTIFAVADAERLGCPDGHELAIEWSRRGASWTGEDDFETAWNSFQPKPGGITIGSLLAMARDARVDLSPWRDAMLASGDDLQQRPVVPQLAQGIPAASATSRRALRVADLPLIPPKRQFLHGTDLVRGAVSMLVAPGGRGKSSWIIGLGLACASGRSLLEAHVFGPPLSVLLINAEDSTSEISLRVRAAMQHHGLTDRDLPKFYVAGADQLSISLLRAQGGAPILNPLGWNALIAELDRIQPDVLILDPLVSVMGGVSTNDNAGAALLMGRLVTLAAERRMGIMVAHHAAKGRDPTSAESAMGAASFVNLARNALAIEPLAESEAGKLGLPPWEARSVFRVVGTKQNLSPPTETDRWFRIASVEMKNADPPVYPTGDRVGVVEIFEPGASGPTFPPELIRAALREIDTATLPLSPSKNATGRYAGTAICRAIFSHRGRANDQEAAAVLDHLVRTGLGPVDSQGIHAGFDL
jgi:hypothetical protein